MKTGGCRGVSCPASNAGRARVLVATRMSEAAVARACIV
jgi:hypothetical protein